MQLLSEESFSVIEPLLSDDYKRIRSRLALLLGAADCEIFANIDMLPNRGKWLTDAPSHLRPYADASPVEKEHIAAYIEDAKARLEPKIAAHIPAAASLFRVPDEKSIFWYTDAQGNTKVVLAQWGFKRTVDPGDVDVIEFLIAQPRPLSTVSVTIEVVYTYGAPLAGKQFMLNIFNNTHTFVTDASGRYYVGEVKAGLKFEVLDAEGKFLAIFEAESGKDIYKVEINKMVSFKIKVIDRNNEPVADYMLTANGQQLTTNADGEIPEMHVIYRQGYTLEVKSEKGPDATFELSPDEPNEFIYHVDLPEVKKPEPPRPEPRKVKVRILDIDGTPLDGVEVFIDQPGGTTISAVSDADGVATFPRDTFVDKKKSNVRFVLTAEYRKAREERKQEMQKRNNGK